MKKNNYALITGASSGLGYELAKLFAADGMNLVLVARRENNLLNLSDELKSEYGVDVRVIPKDLSKVDSCHEIYDWAKDNNMNVEFLVNNAGFGERGSFSSTDWNKELAMINVNVASLTYLTKLFLPKMKESGKGKILNVASVAAFFPGPFMSIYYATKAYVVSFSESIASEIEGTGVTVTTLCPGAFKSEFQERANINDAKFIEGRKIPTSKEIADFGYYHMMRGSGVVVPGIQSKLQVFVSRILPRKLLADVVKNMQKTRSNVLNNMN